MRGQGVGSARRIAAGALLIWAIPFAARAADWLEVTYQSDPAGAALYEGSRLMGHLPLKLPSGEDLQAKQNVYFPHATDGAMGQRRTVFSD